MKYILKQPRFLNPSWYNDNKHRQTEVASSDGGLLVDGQYLHGDLPPGKYMFSIGREFVAEDMESLLAEREKKREEAREYREIQELRARALEIRRKIHFDAFSSSHSLPEGFWFGLKLNARGLSKNSSGNGETRSSVIHILTNDLGPGDLNNYRLAKPLCGYKAKGWVGDAYSRLEGHAPTCKACLKNAAKFRKLDA